MYVYACGCTVREVDACFCLGERLFRDSYTSGHCVARNYLRYGSIFFRAIIKNDLKFFLL